MDELAAHLQGLTFADRTADEVTALLIDAAAAWGADRGWRVYRRAASVFTLPPPYDKQHSVVDLAFARPDQPPVVLEVDHTDRRRTVEKLRAEAQAGRVAVWIRWSAGRIEPPPAGISLIAIAVTQRRALDKTLRFSHFPTIDRPPPSHQAAIIPEGGTEELF